MARKRPTASNVIPPPLTCIYGGRGDDQPAPVPPPTTARRVLHDTERLSTAVWSLFDTLQDRLALVEDRGRAVVREVVSLRAAVSQVQRSVDELSFLQDTMQARLDALDTAGGQARDTTADAEPCPLSTREIEILACLAEGKVYKQIALELSVSSSTVRTHLHNVYGKLGAVDRAQAVLLASRRGWL